MNTIVIGITKMIGTGDAQTDWNLIMATAMLAMLPPVTRHPADAAMVREGPGGDREVRGPLLLALGLLAVTAVVGSVTAAAQA